MHLHAPAQVFRRAVAMRHAWKALARAAAVLPALNENLDGADVVPAKLADVQHLGPAPWSLWRRSNPAGVTDLASPIPPQSLLLWCVPAGPCNICYEQH